jgi:4'-phosphopantetheinyl transferase
VSRSTERLLEPRTRLGKDDIHVFAFGLELAPERLGTLRGWLSPDERARADRFRSPWSDRFVAGRGRLREILARYLDTDPGAVAFAYGPSGKPRLSGKGALTFNLSHSASEAVLAVAWVRELGIDIEKIRPDVECETIAREFFSPSETAALMALPSEARRRGFFACWTRKEAFIKAKGKGLGFPLADFDVSVDPLGPPRLLRTEWDPCERSRWSLRAIDAPPGFVAALAVSGRETRLRVCRVTVPAEEAPRLSPGYERPSQDGDKRPERRLLIGQ